MQKPENLRQEPPIIILMMKKCRINWSSNGCTFVEVHKGHLKWYGTCEIELFWTNGMKI